MYTIIAINEANNPIVHAIANNASNISIIVLILIKLKSKQFMHTYINKASSSSVSFEKFVIA
jgi:hypothetical protein